MVRKILVCSPETQEGPSLYLSLRRKREDKRSKDVGLGHRKVARFLRSVCDEVSGMRYQECPSRRTGG